MDLPIHFLKPKDATVTFLVIYKMSQTAIQLNVSKK